jgi:hypothetical protein
MERKQLRTYAGLTESPRYRKEQTMRTFTNSLLPLAGASLVLAAATACSSSSAIPPAAGGANPIGSAVATAAESTHVSQSTHSIVEAPSAKKAKALLYVADFYNNEISVFDQSKKAPAQPKYVIKSAGDPRGITTDKSGNLYVADTVRNSIDIYAPGATSPTIRITNGVNTPEDVAVDAYGNIYESNDPSGTSNYVNEYSVNTTSPFTTWYPPSDHSNAEFAGLALLYPNEDASSQILVAFNVPNDPYTTGDIATCVPGNSTCFDDSYALNGPVVGIAEEEQPEGSQPWDVLVSSVGIMGIYNIENGTTITQLPTQVSPGYIAFNSDRTVLWVASDGGGSIDEYSYPKMKLITSYTDPGGNASGIAVSPAGTYF